MQFTGHKAATQRWIETPTTCGTRHASYDLSVGKVIVDGKEVQPESTLNAFEIGPQQMFVIVSKERVSIPRSGVSCLAFPKTSLCKQGLLTLNTGIVDPGYRGLISTTAINFHRRPITLLLDDPFLRLVFFQLDCDRTSPTLVANEREYLRGLLDQSIELPTSFLDVPATVDSLQNKLRDQLRSDNMQFSIWKLGAVLTLAALLLTICLSLLPAITPKLTGSFFVNSTDVEHERQLHHIRREIERLTEEIDAIKQSPDGDDTE